VDAVFLEAGIDRAARCVVRCCDSGNTCHAWKPSRV